jgi:hypothetical protein
MEITAACDREHIAILKERIMRVKGGNKHSTGVSKRGYRQK